jgi:hypothetical protein
MKITTQKSKIIKTVLVFIMIATLLVVVLGCEDMGFSPSGTDEDSTETETTTETKNPTVNTKDAAILAVYRHLLEQAGSYDAKIYLSDFYANCDNWEAQSEYFKDGSDTWHIVVDMTDILNWDLNTYWQQASWFVFKDGEVIPSNLFQANALRIEADLQSLSKEDVAEPD